MCTRPRTIVILATLLAMICGYGTGASQDANLSIERTCKLAWSGFTVFAENRKYGNTGLAYNSKEGLLVHSRYDWFHSSKLVLTDFTGSHLREIDVTSLIDHIQDVTYNWDDDTYFIWGTEKGVPHKPWTDGIVLIEVDTSGALLRKAKLDNSVNNPGALAYAGQHTIWVKPNNRTAAYKYHTDTWELLTAIDTKINGEGIAVDGEQNLWLHDGKKVVKLNPRTMQELIRLPSPTKRGHAEGIAVDLHGRVWVGADEGYKVNEPSGNRVWGILPDETCYMTKRRLHRKTRKQA